MCPLNCVLSTALLNALSLICFVFSYGEVTEPKLQNAALSIHFLCILNETDTTSKQCEFMQLQCGRKKEVGWRDRQKFISLAISSDPRAGTAHMPSGFSTDRIQKISLFLTPDMSIWQRPASFTMLAGCKDIGGSGLQIGSSHHSWKCIFCHWDSRKWRDRHRGRRKQSKTAFPLILKHRMQIFPREAERNSWVILLLCLKTCSDLKGDLPTLPKFQNVLMSEFYSIYMSSMKSSQLPVYHKSLLSSPFLHLLHWNLYNFQYKTPMHN